jgi:hypothetical protein
VKAGEFLLEFLFRYQLKRDVPNMIKKPYSAITVCLRIPPRETCGTRRVPNGIPVKGSDVQVWKILPVQGRRCFDRFGGTILIQKT